MTDAPAPDGFTDNVAQRRFERVENGLLAHADYRHRGEAVVLPHVEADPALRGTGAAARLMEDVVAHVRARGLKVTPTCSYAVAWFARHPEHEDLLA